MGVFKNRVQGGLGSSVSEGNIGPMGQKLQSVKKGKGGRKSAWRAWVRTARPCAYIYRRTRLYYTKAQKTAWFVKCMVSPTADSNSEWQGAPVRLHHRALPFLCNFPCRQTAISEADRRTANPVRVYAPNLQN